jgi:hypothetical protein
MVPNVAPIVPVFVSYNNRPNVTISFCLIGRLLETTSTVRVVIWRSGSIAEKVHETFPEHTISRDLHTWRLFEKEQLSHAFIAHAECGRHQQ